MLTWRNSYASQIRTENTTMTLMYCYVCNIFNQHFHTGSFKLTEFAKICYFTQRHISTASEWFHRHVERVPNNFNSFSFCFGCIFLEDQYIFTGMWKRYSIVWFINNDTKSSRWFRLSIWQQFSFLYSGPKSFNSILWQMPPK